MCLTIKKKEPKIATKDWYVYKLLRIDMTSPYRDKKYVINKKVRCKKLGIRSRNGFITKRGKQVWGKDVKIDVNQGIHYCCNLEDAKLYSTKLLLLGRLLVVECILPKGATYVEGPTIKTINRIATDVFLGASTCLIPHRIVGEIFRGEIKLYQP